MAGGLSPIGFGAPAPQGFGGGGGDTALGTILYMAASSGTKVALANGQTVRVDNPASFPFETRLGAACANTNVPDNVDISYSAFGQGVFMLIGGSKCYTTANGKSFTARALPAVSNVNAVVFDPVTNLFWILADKNKFYSTADAGITWSAAQSAPTPAASFVIDGCNLFYANGFFCYYGNYYDNTGNSFIGTYLYVGTPAGGWTQIASPNSYVIFRSFVKAGSYYWIISGAGTNNNFYSTNGTDYTQFLYQHDSAQSYNGPIIAASGFVYFFGISGSSANTRINLLRASGNTAPSTLTTLPGSLVFGKALNYFSACVAIGNAIVAVGSCIAYTSTTGGFRSSSHWERQR